MIAFAAVMALTATTILAGWAYFDRFRLDRPPLGTVNLGDVAAIVGGVILVPYLYLALPSWMVGGLLAVTTLAVLLMLAAPVVDPLWARWAIAVGLVGADIALAVERGTASRAFLLVNDAVLLLFVVGVTNLWAQGGLRARDLAILAAAITFYDAVATGWLPLTSDLIDRLAGLPFVPMFAWPAGEGEWLGIGLGDLLLATVAPLTLRKAYGRSAGRTAIALALLAIGGVIALAASGALRGAFPTMLVLGPLFIGQYLFWDRRRGGERTTYRFLLDESQSSA